MNKHTSGRFVSGAVATLVLVMFALTACDSPMQSNNSQSTATVLPDPRPIAPFELHDQDGAPFAREQLTGEWTLLFMGFTSCGGVCPTTMAKLGMVAGQVPDNVRIVFLSVDPERDTQPVLREYVRAFGDDIIGITGDPAEIEKVTNSIGVAFAVVKEDGNYDVSHSASIFLINPDAAFAAVMSQPHDVAAISEAVRELLAAG